LSNMIEHLCAFYMRKARPATDRVPRVREASGLMPDVAGALKRTEAPEEGVGGGS
jgi:hypothetical protein